MVALEGNFASIDRLSMEFMSSLLLELVKLVALTLRAGIEGAK
jgi:hypothetical protein